MLSNPNIDLVNINAYPKFDQIIILSICSIDEPPHDKTN